MRSEDEQSPQGTALTGSGQAALATGLAYFQAWTSHDFDGAMGYIADDIICLAPAGRLEGAAAFRAFMEPFSQIVTRAALVAGFGDDTKAVVVYDTDTVPVQDAPGAECVTVEDGKITHRDLRGFPCPAPAAATARPRVAKPGWAWRPDTFFPGLRGPRGPCLFTG